MNRTQSIAAAAIIIALGATGCSAAAQPVVNRPTATAAVSSAPTLAPTLTPAPAAKQATWGDTVTTPSGLAITLSLIGVLPAASYTEGGKYSGQTTVFQVTVRNGTTQQVDGSQFVMAAPSVTYGALGEHAQPNGWDGYTWPDMGTLMPGEAQTAKVGVDIPAAGFSDVRVAFELPRALSPTPAVFKGAVK